ncbi:phospho-N-acetylmuramoyl-pentapeptide-transferase [[Clostridium] polysaccharolyticum]|uniref:Phospho-N-acetylmuramoyl-pentapeptide-transferase n=1 Tax=[Clostridium] polysaccharolyticum TaxID=29364 RepID=A0A1H9Y0Z8_9FIRM|nr:phospho-N-acetylmuramoyl-pentapeptide-transferase [[Clostridium] polysaccharolyticum]SES62421.1 Phospho-N-acetylmuramoyl-pentapeptide-transferase [[Clostridium] polysaccharolyticum]
MESKVIIAVLISFAISVVLSPVFIPFLKKLKFGQFVRDEGPESHLKKAGTPTMGGLIILCSIVVTSLFYVREDKEIIPVLFATLGFGLVGFLDDYIKVVMKRSLGLRPWQKFLAQVVVTAVFYLYTSSKCNLGTDTIIPFYGLVTLPSWLYVTLMFFVIIGTVNGANFTDGLDGLASSVTVCIATFFAVIAIGTGNGIAPITCAVTGSLLGFLVYNVYPARVFMGDTGSLALGGFVAAAAYMLKMPFFILIVAFIYLAEVLSVMIQVSYFKISHGKRIFKMAPIHHHFELCGWSETRVVAIFSIVTGLLCLIAYLAI